MESEQKQIDHHKDEEKIQQILRQTDYDEQTAKEKLVQFNFVVEHVVRDYLGLPLVSATAHKKSATTSKYATRTIYAELDELMTDIEKTRTEIIRKQEEDKRRALETR